MNDKKKSQEVSDLLLALDLEGLADVANKVAKVYGYDSVKAFMDSLGSTGASQESSDSGESEAKICDVILTEFDTSKKMAIIKHIKDVFKCSAIQAKEMSEKLPLTIKSGIAIKDADEVIKEWQALGGKLEKKIT